MSSFARSFAHLPRRSDTIPALDTLVEDGLTFIGRAQLLRMEQHLGMAALFALELNLHSVVGIIGQVERTSEQTSERRDADTVARFSSVLATPFRLRSL